MTPVRIEKAGNRIYLRSADALRLKGRIPGANFLGRGADPKWSMPLSIEICYLLRDLFGDRLVIGPELAGWAHEFARQSARLARLRAKKRAKLPTLRKRFPALHAAVRKGRPYQSIGARWIADAGTSLIGDGVGLGKTAQALAGVIESGVAGPYLIVCPKTAVLNTWAPEVRHWLPGEPIVTLPEGRAARIAALERMRRHAQLGRTWVIVHPEALRTQSWWVCRVCGSETPLTHKPKEMVCGHDPRRSRTRHDHVFPLLFEQKWGAIICDESSKSLIRITGTPTLVRRGMEMLRDDCRAEGGLLIAQDATPSRSRPKLIWSTLNWLRPLEYTSFWNWAVLFFEVENGYGGSMKIGKLREDRLELFYASLDRVMLRRTRQEVAGHLPAKQYLGTPLDGYEGDGAAPVAVWLEMDPKQARAYKSMLEESSAELDGGHLDAIGQLAEFTRLQQFATSAGRMDGTEFLPALPSNKFDYLVDLLEQYGFPDDPQCKLVVVSRFTAVLDLFHNELGRLYGPQQFVALTGSVSDKRRTEAIESFNRPVGSGAHVMLLNTMAGGTALTLDSADEMVFLDQTWVSDDQEQVEGRIDNRRPEEKIVQRRYRYLASRGTVDEDVAIVNADRGSVTSHLMDGRRGVQILRNVLEA